LQGIHPLEREAVIQRLRIAGTRTAALTPRGNAIWTVRKGKFSERPVVAAYCTSCSESFVIPARSVNEILAANPKPTFSHCGKNEEVPTDIIRQFAIALGGPSDSDLAWDYQQLHDRNQQIPEEQARKDRAIAARLVGENDPQLGPKPLSAEDSLAAKADAVIKKVEQLFKK